MAKSPPKKTLSKMPSVVKNLTKKFDLNTALQELKEHSTEDKKFLVEILKHLEKIAKLKNENEKTKQIERIKELENEERSNRRHTWFWIFVWFCFTFSEEAVELLSTLFKGLSSIGFGETRWILSIILALVVVIIIISKYKRKNLFHLMKFLFKKSKFF